MTRKALTILLALIAPPMPAMAGQRTIYANDGNVVGRYTTDRQGTTTLYGRDGGVVSRGTGNTVIMHDGVSGQVFGDRPKRGKRR
jgi:hypothetical protein